MLSIHHLLKSIPQGKESQHLAEGLFGDLPIEKDCTAEPIAESTWCACKAYNNK